MRYDAGRIAADMALRGWEPKDIGRRAKLHPETVRRFLSGYCQTAKTAIKLARALGYRTTRRYMMEAGS